VESKKVEKEVEGRLTRMVEVVIALIGELLLLGSERFVEVVHMDQ